MALSDEFYKIKNGGFASKTLKAEQLTLFSLIFKFKVN